MARTLHVPLAGKVTLHVEGSMGNLQLRQAESADATDGSSNTIVNGPSGVLGQVRQDGGITISLVVRRVARVAPEVNWVELRETQEEFVFAYQDEGGQRFTVEGCRVSKIDWNAPNDGNLTQTVEIMGLNYTTTLPVVEA